jgi:hypothetical protein
VFISVKQSANRTDISTVKIHGTFLITNCGFEGGGQKGKENPRNISCKLHAIYKYNSQIIYIFDMQWKKVYHMKSQIKDVKF